MVIVAEHAYWTRPEAHYYTHKSGFIVKVWTWFGLWFAFGLSYDGVT